MPVEVRPAMLEEIPRIAEFMASRLGGRGPDAHPPERYRRYLEYRWPVERGDAGVVIEDAGELRGVIGAIYSTRTIERVHHRFCNLTSIAVDDSHRKWSLQAFATLFRRKDVTFTVFSASEAVQKILEFFKFAKRASSRVILPPVGFTGLVHRATGRVRVVTNTEDIVRELQGSERTIAEDHARHGCAQVLLERGGVRSHVVAVRRGHGARTFADILYASDRALCVAEISSIQPSLARSLRTPLIGLDASWTSKRPLVSATYAKLRPVYARSPVLNIDEVDALYSELVALGSR